jgi:hypothetical protein
MRLHKELIHEAEQMRVARQAKDRVEWRKRRAVAFMGRRLIPYFEKGVDRGVDKAVRCLEGVYAFTEFVFVLPELCHICASVEDPLVGVHTSFRS